MEAREAEKKRVREEERAAYLQEVTEEIRAANAVPEGEEENEDEEAEPRPTEEDIQKEIDEKMAQWDEDRMQQEKDADENDPEMPNYEAMEEVEIEKLREQRTNDDTFFEEFIAALRDKEVVVIDDIRADTSAEFVHIKILDRLKDNF